MLVSTSSTADESVRYTSWGPRIFVLLPRLVTCTGTVPLIFFSFSPLVELSVNNNNFTANVDDGRIKV